ncbi:OTU domain-containing protein [Rhizobacter sp. OV335]|uniref:OTU domain-containing protein n=1 Tax=Rhizobacter sp. OV335 TaxID=1500264 RepID=UPI00091B5410|nr:OTU domain-containing protein [Rhizobacter sp. OV335]SHM52702.1 hypothetical protein SAMN02787076_01504 [Rhizobacter sp. OV335]
MNLMKLMGSARRGAQSLLDSAVRRPGMPGRPPLQQPLGPRPQGSFPGQPPLRFQPPQFPPLRTGAAWPQGQPAGARPRVDIAQLNAAGKQGFNGPRQKLSVEDLGRVLTAGIDPKRVASGELPFSRPQGTPPRRQADSAPARFDGLGAAPGQSPLQTPRPVRRQSMSGPRFDGPRPIAVPPAGQLAGRHNDVDPVVPHFANLERGTARADGNCFFYSMIHHAGPQIARQMGIAEKDLTPQAIRQHIAAEMISNFQMANLGVDNVPMLYGAVLGELREGKKPVSAEQYRAAVGTRLADQSHTLTPNQLTHVAEVAENFSYKDGACDYMPALMAQTFPGLRIVAHTAATTPANEDNYSFKAEGADGVPMSTVRLFLDEGRKHYEPVFDK